MSFGMIMSNQNMVKMQNSMETDIFIIHVKTEDTYKDIAEDVETRYCHKTDHCRKEKIKN